MGDRLRTSVIVCTYSDERLPLLRDALGGVRSQEPACDELIIVVDHNPELARRLTEEYPNAVVVESTGPRGLSGARNTGVSVATGDVLVFLDDDAAPRPGWLRHLVAPFADASIAATGGRAEPRWERGERPEWLPEELDWVVGCSFRGQAKGDVRNPIGASMALRASMVERVGGFSTALGRIGTLPVGCEETEMGLRINRAGGRIVLADESIVDHFVPASRSRLRYVLRRCYAEGLSKAVVRRLVQESGADEGALGPERRYVLTLAAAVLRAAPIAVRRRNPAAAAPVLLVPASLVAAALGFGRGAVSSRRG
jgi:GT2 family glycosyltransferase